MLVLSRRAGESLFIGPDVEVIILRICANHIKVGIKAPPEIGIYREPELEADFDQEASHL